MQGLQSVRVIAVGAFHNLALIDDGTVMAWGNNEYGQLGIGDTQPRSQPVAVQGLSDLNLVCIVLPPLLYLLEALSYLLIAQYLVRIIVY